jgi:S-adenosylmethionine:tRNA ribosyltransferase-isomerase
MELKEFQYELPRSLIAATPAADRAAARLMVVRRGTGEISHGSFSALGDFLRAGDLLVLNDTRVFPARLRGRKESGGEVELLLVEPFPHWPGLWIALIDAAKKPQVGSRIIFASDVTAEIIGEMGRGRYGVKFHHKGDFMSLLERIGEPPIPPYVGKQRAVATVDWERYQTVYARHVGAVAAPTAGFHFTSDFLDALGERGIEKAFLTLHVGPGTFEPVRENEVEKHRMEGERYSLTGETAEKINRAKARGNKVVAVGSTTTRALEWIARRKGRVEADEGIARLFIYPGDSLGVIDAPGDSFRVIDALVTNFHLPGSTPLLLVAAFAGLDLIRRAYEEAIRAEYRFYSYGDAMLIL